MNTIPLIFNERQVNITVLGGQQAVPEPRMNVSVILLNGSGSNFRVQSLENLLKCGFRSIVSVEPDPGDFNIEDISRRYPSVKFIIPLERVTDGDLINIGMSEISSEYALVLRDSLSIPDGVLLPNLAGNLTKSGCYCVVPRLLDSGGRGFSVRFSPEAERGRFRVTPSSVVTDGAPTLYPFDSVGLYNREKFIRLGGFDYTITSPYWQNADLAVRSWLWGERTLLSTSFRLSYAEDVPVEDSTADLSYLRFYLKNLLPKFKIDHGVIGPPAFFRFLRNSSCGFFEALRQFSDARRWTEKNQYRFRTDIQSLIEGWESQK